jgi:integrase
MAKTGAPMPLTNIKCNNAQPGAKPYRLSDSGGMYLEIMPNGSKYWRLKYRFNGKEKRLALGVYPRVSLAEAREAREKARKLLSGGADPSEVKKDKKKQASLNAENTFEALAREWHEHNKLRWTDNHAKTTLHRLEMDIFPEIGKRPVRDITPPQILEALRKIESRGAYEIARRAMQVCSQIFRYAVATGRMESDPTRDLKGALKPFRKGHYTALDAKDLPEFLNALNRNEQRLYPQTIRAVKLLMLTFVRTGELIGAKWDEINWEAKEWHIPAERMKMRKPHIVPLSKQVIAILKEQKEMTGQWEWIFPNLVRPKGHMSNNTILMALRRMGYQDKTTGHGFRALAMSTIKEKLGYRHEVVDRQLAHAPRNKVDAAYDRAQFLPERKKMMQHWADYLDAVATGGNVIKARFSGK